jgi:hypothetical protein
VHLIGGGRRFLHYQCGNCSEVWTAQSAPASALLGSSSSELTPLTAQKGNVLLN